MWAIGLIATIGIGWNATNSTANNRQDDKIYEINAQVASVGASLQSIKEIVNEIKAAQKAQFERQGIDWKVVEKSIKNELAN